MKEETLISENLLLIEGYLREMTEVILRLDHEKIDRAINILYDAWRQGNQVFIFGNGGSASTATHFACDLAKTTISEGKRRFKVQSLVDNIPLISAFTNDDGFESIYCEQLKAHLNPGDVVIAISVHGGSGHGNATAWSQNLLRGVDWAKENGARTIGLSGFDGGALALMADVCMVVPCDSTPHVESLHLALEHLICDRLREQISDSPEGRLS